MSEARKIASFNISAAIKDNSNIRPKINFNFNSELIGLAYYKFYKIGFNYLFSEI